MEVYKCWDVFTRHNAWSYGRYSRTAFGGDFGQGLEEQAVSGHGEQNSGHREHRPQKAGETNPGKHPQNPQRTLMVKHFKHKFILKCRSSALSPPPPPPGRSSRTWWTERRATPRLPHIWLDPSWCIERPQAGGFFHRASSRASLGWEQPTRRSTPRSRWVTRPRYPEE